MMGLPGHTSNHDGDNWSQSGPWVRFGLYSVCGLVAGLTLFAAFVSISGAVVATGTVTVESKYQSVQHLDGGIVARIDVKNGERVRKGQTLVVLDQTAAQANLIAIDGRVGDLVLQQARLEAERDGLEEMQLPDGLDLAQTAIANAIKAQNALFQARRRARSGELAVLDQRVSQLTSEVQSLKAQRAARGKELAINTKELETVMPLFERGFVSLPRLSPLQREQARLEGEIGRLDAEVGKAKSGLAETELRKAQADKQYIREVVDELGKVEAALAEQRQAQAKIADVMSRIEIKAPRAGHVHGLEVHTVGGVIRPAMQIAQIIPEGERMMVEAQLPVREIDRVRPGQHAQVMFPAFNARTTPRLDGSVVKVSPAETRDERGRTFYTAVIDIPAQEMAKIGRGHALIPGMPAEVFIETSSRSILSYILKPLTDSMMQAFRER